MQTRWSNTNTVAGSDTNADADTNPNTGSNADADTNATTGLHPAAAKYDCLAGRRQ